MRSHFNSVTRACAATLFLASLAAAQSPVLATDSVTPQNGIGGSQVFTFVFSDSNGYQDLLNRASKILFAGDAGSSGNNFCWVGIYPNGIYLAQDNLSAAWAFAGYGSTDIAQNSQCAINGAGTTISGSGNNLTLNLSVTFRVAYAGMKTIYTDVNSSGSDAQVGTYNVTATAPDFILSISPSSQTVQAGQSTTYTVTAAAQNGFNQDITLSATQFAGTSGSFSPAVIAGGNGTSTLTIAAAQSAGSQSGEIFITGTSASVTHTTSTQLTVNAAGPPPPPTLSTDSLTPQNGSGGNQVFTFVFSDSNGYQDLLNRSEKIIFAGDAGSSGTNYCWVGIYPNGIYLAQDDLGAAWAFVAYGSSGSAQNSQCQINGSGTTISGSGNTLTLNLSITFRAAYAGMKTISTNVNSSGDYEQVGTFDVTSTSSDFTLSVSPSSQTVQAGQSTTYTVTATGQNGFSDNITLSTTQFAGTSGSFNPSVITGGSGTSTLTITASPSAGSQSGQITITGTSPSVTHTATAQLTVNAAGPPPPPTLSTDSVSPQNGSGGSQAFTFVFSDSNGYQDLLNGAYKVLFAGNAGSTGTNFCWIGLYPNGIYLAQDNLNAAWAFLAYGSSASVQNSQCQINGAGTSISGSGNTLTLNLSITFRVAYAGMKTIYTDVNSTGQGYTSVGTYNVTATAPDFTISVAPSSQSTQAGQGVTYTVTETPLNGFNQAVNLTLETDTSDNASGVSGTLSPTVIPAGGGTSTLTVTVAASTPASTWQFIVTGTSPSITHAASPVQLSVSGQAPPPPPTVSTDSVSPQNGSGSAQVFTFMFSDSAGYNDLLGGKYHILINTSPNGSGSCWFLLESTGLYLAPDDPSQAWSFASYGSSQTASNSQCGVSGVGTNISGSGNSLTLSLSLTFTGAFDGTKNVYTDVNASSPGYVAATTYTVQ